MKYHCNCNFLFNSRWSFFIACIISILFSQSAFPQHTLLKKTTIITGKVISSIDSTPLAFAHVVNHSTGKAVVTNASGVFKIPVQNEGDSVTISFLGYAPFTLKLIKGKFFFRAVLQPHSYELGQVLIIEEDDDRLYEIINDCRKSKYDTAAQAKGYYELKSFANENQIEQVEAFYNLNIKGRHVKDLNIKTGRTALKPFQNIFFASLESSKAIISYDVKSRDRLFPRNPLDMSKLRLKAKYELSLESAFITGNQDTIYEISFTPKDNTDQRLFYGSAWINTREKALLKINLKIDSTIAHPFLPINEKDEIEHVSYDITNSYIKNGHQYLFSHSHFNYTVTYRNNTSQTTYPINTKATLYAYDFNNLFIEPFFEFPEEHIGDYEKINIIPHDPAFWKYHADYQLEKLSTDDNSAFLADSLTIHSGSERNLRTIKQMGYFNRVFTRWSPGRFVFQNPKKPMNRYDDFLFIADQYNIDIKLFMNLNEYGDSTSVQTAALFDPYRSYYNLKLDINVHCYINMKFDLVEIAHRKLVMEISKNRGDKEQIISIYKTQNKILTEILEDFENETERGCNEKAMEKWNKYIYKALGIDNLEVFKPYASADR